MNRQYRIKKTPRHANSSAKPGYFLDAVIEGGALYDTYPEYHCHELNADSHEFHYSIEEYSGEREKTAPIRSGNYATANQGRTQPIFNAGSRAL